ncbi:MAG: hypothetical protein RPU90_04355 [Candidatus Sedimenticola sp. (ex Thyasira tokunagai)]
MDTPLKTYLRAWWPQWVPGVLAATTTTWVLWGLSPVLLATLAITAGGMAFLFSAFVGMAADYS